jgi:hypothetical protein
VVKPSQRKKMAQASVINRAISIQLACSFLSLVKRVIGARLSSVVRMDS